MRTFKTTQRNPVDRVTELQIDVWKKIVDVQQHFNDLELRIRNLMVTILGAMFGAAGFALKEKIDLAFAGTGISLESFIIGVATVIIAGFWFMDRHWYHRLLVGAVRQGLDIEGRLEQKIPGSSLAKSIGAASPITILGKRIRSSDKIDIFYGLFFVPSLLGFTFLVSVHVGQVLSIIVFHLLIFWAVTLEDAPI